MLPWCTASWNTIVLRSILQRATTLADATLYLELFGILAIGWQWLRQGIAAQKALQNKCSEADQIFYMGKMVVLKYFFGYEIPKTLGLADRLLNNDGLTLEMKSDYFD